MIRWIDSSIPSFKRLEFHEGLNVLLADAVEDGGDGQTRNSAGKSSFVLIVDFLLGANCNDKSLFRSDALKDARFSGGFRLGGHGIEVERSGSNHNRIYILSSDDDLGDAVEVEEDTGRLFVTLATWKRFLGTRAFGLPSNPQGTDFAKNPLLQRGPCSSTLCAWKATGDSCTPSEPAKTSSVRLGRVPFPTCSDWNGGYLSVSKSCATEKKR